MKRVFIAADISDQARQRAASYTGALKEEFSGMRVGWVRPENLHLTLKFIGSFETSRLPNLDSVVASTAACYSPFSLSIAGTGAFTKRQKHGVLWLGVRMGPEKVGESELEKIGRMLNENCSALGIEKTSRPLLPHLTIARIKEPEKARNLVDRHLAAGFGPVKFEITELVLYESRLLAGGSVYSAISRHSFSQG